MSLASQSTFSLPPQLSWEESEVAARRQLSADGWQTLRDRASQGDAQAAFELALRLGSCTSIGHELDLIEARVQRDDVDPTMAERELESVEQNIGNCAGVEARDSEPLEALQTAARLGHVEAIRFRFSLPAFVNGQPEMSAAQALGLAREILAYKQETLVMMQQLAHRGHSSALGDLAFAYAGGDRTAKDLARAVAYYRAAERRRTETDMSHVDTANYYETLLDSAQRTEADRIERELERAIAACCG